MLESAHAQARIHDEVLVLADVGLRLREKLIVPMRQRVSPRLGTGARAKALRGSDGPRPDQRTQRDTRELVERRLVHQDDGENDGSTELVDIRNRGLDRVAGRNDVVHDQHFLPLRGCVVRRERAALPMALFAWTIDDELLSELLADQRCEGNPVNRDANHRIGVDLAFLHLLEDDVRHGRGHEPDPVPVHPDGPPTDLHVLGRLASLHPAGQQPGDGLWGQMELVRDLLLREALLLVVQGLLGNRVHILHPFTLSDACDAGWRISSYRTPLVDVSVIGRVTGPLLTSPAVPSPYVRGSRGRTSSAGSPRTGSCRERASLSTSSQDPSSRPSEAPG